MVFSAQLHTDGETYNPSKFTTFAFLSSKSGYKKKDFGEPYTGKKKIICFCTDDGKMKMKNEKIFNSGNHPIELFAPMLHMKDAGFEFEIATGSGKPVVLEMWAYPKKDKAVKELHDELKDQMENPTSIADIKNLDGYAAVFIPGGHGAMINLPKNVALGKLLHEAHEKGIPTVTLCHGPAALLSTAAEGVGKEFAYSGYKMMCFTDKTDAFTPKVGYLPGLMPWGCQATLEENGVTIVNTTEKGDVIVDRELITGDSPSAAINLGIEATPIILKYAKENP